MARRETVEIVDDLDGTPDAQTVSFAVEGRQYTIDLGDENRQRFFDGLAPFIAAANTAKRTKKTGLRSVPTSPARRDKEQTAAIRKWARENNWEISDRGRIPHEIEEAYDKAQGLAS